MYFHYNVTTRT